LKKYLGKIKTRVCKKKAKENYEIVKGLKKY